MQQPDIIGWGADASLERRPGVPEERHPPKPFGGIAGFPSQQIVGTPSVTSRYRPLTPVYGTAIPPRGLSGVIRRLAYRIPDYKARRWVLLIVADRVDVIEHNPLPLTLGLGALVTVLLGVRALSKR
ncbi:MAG: hypothetical protein K0S65_3011 [Labilithrix sp.]|nr:hypothetical protein [Labilithrix sp.]